MYRMEALRGRLTHRGLRLCVVVELAVAVVLGFLGGVGR
jgi:hypothetical protein